MVSFSLGFGDNQHHLMESKEILVREGQTAKTGQAEKYFDAEVSEKGTPQPIKLEVKRFEEEGRAIKARV